MRSVLRFFVTMMLLGIPVTSHTAESSKAGQIPALAATATTPNAADTSTTFRPATRARVIEDYGKLSLTFEVNRGQTDEQVKFLSRGSGYTLFLTADEAVLALRDNSDVDHDAVLHLKLVGANPEPRVSGVQEQSGKVNYFVGNDPSQWRTNVSTYARVRYETVYPGVDLVYYGSQQKLEYDFVVAPGADPKVIRLQFEGAESVELDDRGDLLLHTSAGDVRLHRPIIYQNAESGRVEIDGDYELLVVTTGLPVGPYWGTSDALAPRP
jgi:hypothetical protein